MADVHTMVKLLASGAVQEYNNHKHTGEIDSINKAVDMAARSIQLAPPGSDLLPALYSNYGVMFITRYQRIGHIADLEGAIRAVQQAVDLTPDDHLDRAAMLNNLGNHLENRHRRTGNIADLEAAIQIAWQVVHSTPDGHPDRKGYLANIGNYLGSLYRQTGNMVHLESAIRAVQQAVDLTPDDHPDRPGRLSSLGNHLECRYERTGDLEDLEAAIRVAQQAVDLTSDSHPTRPGWLNNLGNVLGSRYQRRGSITDLEAAVRVAQQAVDLTPDDHPDRPGRLSSFGTKLFCQYERTGSMAHLKEAIQLIRQAIESTPDSHPDRPGRLSSLGNMLGKWYQQTDDMADLEAAIKAAQQAIDSTPENHPDQAARLTNLGTHIASRYERKGEIADLEAAIQAAQQAVDSTPENHPDRAAMLSNLGSYLGNWYEQTGAMDNLEAAIQAAQQAVKLTLDNHPGRAAMLNNLGNVLARRYEKTSEMSDLEAAIHAAQQAVDSTPHSHPDRAMHLTNLGSRLESRYKRRDDRADLKKSGDSFLAAWKCETGIPFYRVQAAARCVDILALQKELCHAAELAVGAIELLPSISNRSLQSSDQQYAVSHFSGLAASACSVYLRLGWPKQALEILERGRTVILSQLIGDRSDISALREAHPKVADRFQNLLDEINAPLPRPNDLLTMKWAQRRRQECVARFESCVQEIRTMPGYDRFLLGLTPAEMCACATEGPIVVVNVTTIGSHAIVVTSSGIKSMELSTLSASDAQRWLNRQWNTDRKGLSDCNREFCEYLDWLWQVCVKDVSMACGLRVQPATQNLPRIWWIGTGLASSMPFHAAGNHRPGLDRNLFKRVLSSYTPSIKALAYSRERLRRRSVCGDSVLLATMATTPGLPFLSGVEDEKEAISEALRTHFTVDLHDHPCASSIIQRLENCSIAHFACHGLTDYVDPSKSGLVFQKYDGAGSLIHDTVTVQSVSELKLEHARLAYLSACSTAENGAERLRDEVIHIVSGFQVAGFAHVIGCQWPAQDEVSVEVAKAFYGALPRRDRKIEDRDIALGLHEAVSAARQKLLDQPLKWAQYVHYGA